MAVRTFVAVDIPVNRDIERVIEEVRGIKGSKPVMPEQCHITLKFLGDVEEDRIEDISTALDSVCSAFSPFNVEVRGAGAFPKEYRARVFWLGIDPQNDLKELAAAIDDALAGMGFQRESRPFKAHLTIARFKRPTDQLRGLINKYSGSTFTTAKVESVALKKSTLTPTGAVYEDIHISTLGNAGGDGE